VSRISTREASSGLSVAIDHAAMYCSQQCLEQLYNILKSNSDGVGVVAIPVGRSCLPRPAPRWKGLRNLREHLSTLTLHVNNFHPLVLRLSTTTQPAACYLFSSSLACCPPKKYSSLPLPALLAQAASPTTHTQPHNIPCQKCSLDLQGREGEVDIAEAVVDIEVPGSAARVAPSQTTKRTFHHPNQKNKARLGNSRRSTARESLHCASYVKVGATRT
jgi:hypothetical protein